MAVDMGDGDPPAICSVAEPNVVVGTGQNFAMPDQETRCCLRLTHQPAGWIKAADPSPESIAPLEVGLVQIAAKGKKEAAGAAEGGLRSCLLYTSDAADE